MAMRNIISKFLPVFLLILLILVFFNPLITTVSASPDIVTVFLPAVEDAEVTDANPEFNFGGNAFLKIGYCCGEFPGESWVYLKFDLSSIPAGSIP